MYQALYRKYRPKKFSDVVGQNIIVTTLENSIKKSHINHAYLFAGPRGTGKTTIAKIFARAVNCLNYKNEICENCKNCLYSVQKECMDIIEIDAASNNGVDEIRELRNKVKILPSELKYKVYIIDEVHMLSIGAFNALLKTLEEPPEHVIFILATTDPQKIPNTIISRCQTFQFKKISSLDITELLKKISVEENINVEEKVLESIAISSDGGLRDAIGLLDKLSSYKEGKILYNDFLVMNGQITSEDLAKLEDTILFYNATEMLEQIEMYYNDGKDLLQVLKQLIFDLKNKLVDLYIRDISLKYNENNTIKLVNLLNEKISNVKKSDDMKTYIEIILLNFITENKNVKTKFEKKLDIKQHEKETSITTTKVQIKDINPAKIDDNNYSEIESLMTIRAKNTMAEASKSELNKELNIWKKLNDYTFDVNDGYIACELLDGVPRAASEKSIVISYEYTSNVKKIYSHYQKLIDYYNDLFHENKKISFVSNDEWLNLKNEYIDLIKSGNKLKVVEEPRLEKNNSSNVNNRYKMAKELFGDLVEIK